MIDLLYFFRVQTHHRVIKPTHTGHQHQYIFSHIRLSCCSILARLDAFEANEVVLCFDGEKLNGRGGCKTSPDGCQSDKTLSSDTVLPMIEKREAYCTR